ncbi:MAG: hypothetical protein KDC35_00605 [Acidobacteria bacterium]|nr:hypothetical protein [Acidobacteriota bacterium]
MLTALYEIVMTLRPFNSILHIVALIVVAFLFSSPGIAGTVLGVSAKIGIFKFAQSKQREDNQS